MFFMQRRNDAWLPEMDFAISEGCGDYDASGCSIVVVETVAIATAQPVAFVETFSTATFSPQTCTLTRTTGIYLALEQSR
jgi:hypothetical protein